MKKLFISEIILATLLLGACGNEESTAIVEKENDSQVEESESDSQTAENEFITSAIDYASANEKAVDQFDFLLSDLTNVKDPTWQSEVESVVMDIYMTDTSYTLVETSLSEAKMEKYNSTLNHFYESSKLLDSVLGDVTIAIETYDKRKFKEVHKRLPLIKNELGKMKEQLEVERYE